QMRKFQQTQQPPHSLLAPINEAPVIPPIPRAVGPQAPLSAPQTSPGTTPGPLQRQRALRPYPAASDTVYVPFPVPAAASAPAATPHPVN
ncbi:MAG TPA: hypothetical protein VFF72_10725, partial [Caldimonas sp.]|nr:hypothetical protein [Caldimonas sp.]